MPLLAIIAITLAVVFFVAASDVDDAPSKNPKLDAAFHAAFVGLGGVLMFAGFVAALLCFV